MCQLGILLFRCGHDGPNIWLFCERSGVGGAPSGWPCETPNTTAYRIPAMLDACCCLTCCEDTLLVFNRQYYAAAARTETAQHQPTNLQHMSALLDASVQAFTALNHERGIHTLCENKRQEMWQSLHADFPSLYPSVEAARDFRTRRYPS
jgi:hypothetical protein